MSPTLEKVQDVNELLRVLREDGYHVFVTAVSSPQSFAMIEAFERQRVKIPMLVLADRTDECTHEYLARRNFQNCFDPRCDEVESFPGFVKTLLSGGNRCGRNLKKGSGDLKTIRSQLSPRELQVFLLAGGGRDEQEIANELAISKNTVRAHLHHVMTKLQIKHRTALMREAALRGYVRLEGGSISFPGDFLESNEKRRHDLVRGN